MSETMWKPMETPPMEQAAVLADEYAAIMLKDARRHGKAGRLVAERNSAIQSVTASAIAGLIRKCARTHTRSKRCTRTES